MVDYDLIKPFEQEPLSEQAVIAFHAQLRTIWERNDFKYPLCVYKSQIPDMRLIQFYRNSGKWDVQEKHEQEERNGGSVTIYYFNKGGPRLSIRDV